MGFARRSDGLHHIRMRTGRDIAVIGAGAFGVAAALELRRRGWGVVVVDRSAPPNEDASSTDASKMVRMDYGSDVFYHELAEAALDGWDRWNADWPRPLYHDTGFLVLASEPMSPGGDERTVGSTARAGFEYESHRVLRLRGYDPRRIGGRALEDRYPMWRGAGYPDGYLSPRGGWAESEEVVRRLVELGRAAGVRFAEGRVLGVLDQGSRAVGVRLDAGREEVIRANHVLACAGAWTPTLLAATRDLLAPVAQPVLHFGVDDPDAYRGPDFPPFAADIARSGWYGFPALDDGRLKLGHHGPGRTVDPDDRGEVGERHVAKARSFFARAIPSLADAPVVDSRVCLYCDSRDGDLLVDGLPGHDGLTVAAGGSGHGFKFAPVLGGIIADAVEEEANRWLPRFAWRDGETEKGQEARLGEEARLLEENGP